MIAAIYARKSTDQNGVPDAEKTVTRQIDHAPAPTPLVKAGPWMIATSTSMTASAAPSSRTGPESCV